MDTGSGRYFHDHSAALPGGSIWTFDMVEERLVEAMANLWRLPDRERGWLSSGTMALWRQVKREWGDYVDSSEAPRKPGLTRREMAEMEEALGWLSHVPAGESRKIVGIALAFRARGESRVPWVDVRATLIRREGAAAKGWTTDGLRMRYGRALNMICRRLNGGNSSLEAVKP